MVGTHHSLGETPGDLACLLHLANNLCKDLGLGYMADEKGQYSQVVLKALKMEEEDIETLKETLAEDTVDEVKSMVEQCL